MFASSAPCDSPDRPVPLLEAVAEVRAALAQLARADVAGASDAEVRCATAELAKADGELAGGTARVVGEFDARRAWAADGARSAAAWLRLRGGAAGVEASRLVRLARHLRSLPATAAALCAGEIGVAHAQRIVAADTSRTADQLRADEEMIVGWARTERFDRFCRDLDAWVAEHDEDGGFRERPDRRRVHLTRTFQGGWVLDGWLDPVSGKIIDTELGRLERELFEADWADARRRLGRDPRVDELARTPAQRRADALVAMARRSATMPQDAKRGRILITVVTGPGHVQRMCELLDGTLLDPAEVARLIDDETTIERIVFDDDAQPIAASKQRSFTGVLRRAIQIRDRECTHDCCDEPADRCQVDHIIPWSWGGPTSLDNGRLRCGHHNRSRHRAPPPPDDG